MAFWDLERQLADRAALLGGGHECSYAQLARLADAHAARLPEGRRSVGFIGLSADPDLVGLYLGALRSRRHVPLLLQPDTEPSLLVQLSRIYRPEWIALPAGTPAPDGYVPSPLGSGKAILYRCAQPDEAEAEPHPELALLLSTSGSTGSPKLVRLSYAALESNAAAIASYLGLGADDRAIRILPLAYSFGLSILNSHLEAGGAFVLCEEGILSRAFWEEARAAGVTSLSGVPATFEMLRRVDLARSGLSRLRMLTQAGGHMQAPLVEHFLGVCERLRIELFVMYGQTEAAPRISYVPPHLLGKKPGSIGIAIPGGQLELSPDTGELVYRGPNVMLGYAESRADLALGDVQGGVLRTGDLARVDADGFFYITGRAKRFVKISGNRVNLDEMESLLGQTLGYVVACIGGDDDLVVLARDGNAPDPGHVRQVVQATLRMFLPRVRVVSLPEFPLMSTGKIDYAALAALARETAA